MRFEFERKEKLLTFGPYPEVKLSKARDKRDKARRLFRERIDPSGSRKRAQHDREREAAEQAKLVTLEQAARQWHDLQKGPQDSARASTGCDRAARAESPR